MFGEGGEVRGLIPRSVEYLFAQMEQRNKTKEVAMVCSFLEIYNDSVRDLGKAYLVAMGVDSSNNTALASKTSDIYQNLAGKRGNPYFAPAFHSATADPTGAEATARPGVQQVHDEYQTMNYDIREDAEGNVFVKDLSMVPVNTLEEVTSMITMGTKVRATHETNMNANSSRSHTVFSITVIQRDRETGESIQGVLNLVDLAGSERLKKTESVGVRLKEAVHINTSLTALSKVIMSLDPSSEGSHIPFRDSKLTRILQNSLGGNSFTTVLAALHPDPKYYEECLSTLQFANRCRNVKNNPKINYVSDNEDKDRKIKRLMDEIKSLQSKIIGGGGDGGGKHHHAPSMNPANIVALLKKLGMQASMGSDGKLTLNGKKLDVAELGLDEGSTDSAATGASSGGGGGGGFSGGGGGFGGGSKGMNPDKMRRIMTELQESNAKLSVRTKEQKNLLEEQGRNLQESAGEIVKLQTQMKHKDWEYQELYSEKERDIATKEKSLKEKFDADTQRIVAHNKDVLMLQQSVIQSVPETFRSYSMLLKKTDNAREKFDGPIRKEFEQHLASVEENRIRELENIKKQYEHWLNEKDRTLVEFVGKFNKYRTKKSEHLRQCEKEIVCLYEYTEQIENILDGVEKGKYLVSQKQGQHGRSTTGIASRNGTRGGDSRPSSAMQTDTEESFGGVMLPKGLRPNNPLTIPSNEHLELMKKIVGRHKERQAKLEKIKEEAFHKSLHHASMSGSVAADVDPVLQKQIRDLLITPGETRSRTPGGRNASSRPGSVMGSLQNSKQGTPRNTKSAEYAGNEEKKSDSAGGGAFPLAKGAEGKPDSPMFSTRDKGSIQPESWGNKDATASEGANAQSIAASQGSRDTVELALLRAELSELKAARKIDQLSSAKLSEELASNETVQYIRFLELEQERMHKQVKDVATQLHSSKIANASLSRKLSHANQVTA